MNRDSVTRLRLDRRLIERRGWLSREQREHALTDLPDVVDKAITLGEASDERSGNPEAKPPEETPGA